MEQDDTCPMCGRPVEPEQDVCRCGFRLDDEQDEEQPYGEQPTPESVDELPPGPWEEMRDERRPPPQRRRCRVGRLWLAAGIIAACIVALALVGYIILRGTAEELSVRRRIVEEGVTLNIHRVAVSGGNVAVVLRADPPADREAAETQAQAERDVVRTLRACLGEQRFENFLITVQLQSMPGRAEWVTALILDCSRGEAERALQEEDPARVLQAAGAQLNLLERAFQTPPSPTENDTD